MNDQDIRWQQRFSNFQRAFLLLREAMERDPDELNQLEKEGIIQRFEYTFEIDRLGVAIYDREQAITQ